MVMPALDCRQPSFSGQQLFLELPLFGGPNLIPVSRSCQITLESAGIKAPAKPRESLRPWWFSEWEKNYCRVVTAITPPMLPVPNLVVASQERYNRIVETWDAGMLRRVAIGPNCCPSRYTVG
jgi:hypothetical protein